MNTKGLFIFTLLLLLGALLSSCEEDKETQEEQPENGVSFDMQEFYAVRAKWEAWEAEVGESGTNYQIIRYFTSKIPHGRLVPPSGRQTITVINGVAQGQPQSLSDYGITIDKFPFPEDALRCTDTIPRIFDYIENTLLEYKITYIEYDVHHPLYVYFENGWGFICRYRYPLPLPGEAE